MVAAESGLGLIGTVGGAAESVIGNLPLFPKANVLVAHTTTYDGLTDEQQQWLQEAALATRDWSVDTLTDDAAAAAAYCEGGGTVVHDPAADSAAVTTAAAEVTAQLRNDPATSALIDRIAALGSGEPVTAARPLPGRPNDGHRGHDRP